MTHPLLTDPASTVFAVNCSTLDNGDLLCGAIYVMPNNPFAVIRLADSGARFDVELPPELVNSSQAITAWDITLSLATEQHG